MGEKGMGAEGGREGRMKREEKTFFHRKMSGSWGGHDNRNEQVKAYKLIQNKYPKTHLYSFPVLKCNWIICVVYVFWREKDGGRGEGDGEEGG